MVINWYRFLKWKVTMRHKIAIYPGSFDPPTFGHIDIIRRACKMFEELHIVAAVSSKKNYLLTQEERVNLLVESTNDLPNVKVVAWDDLTINYLNKVDAKCIVRGVRNTQDFLYEQDMATMNRSLLPNCENVLFFASPEQSSVSSSFIKEVVSYGGSVSQFVPKNVEAILKSKFNS